MWRVVGILPVYLNGRDLGFQPSYVGSIPTTGSDMNNLDIEDRSKLERQIAGALKSAIAAHGPITLVNHSSATKRVYGLLKALAKEQRDGSDTA